VQGACGVLPSNGKGRLTACRTLVLGAGVDLDQVGRGDGACSDAPQRDPLAEDSLDGQPDLLGTCHRGRRCFGMFGDPKECREHARRCFESARSASTLAMMVRFEGLAHSWLRLAEDLERAEALLERLKEPERKAS
jgi:hypothetical protein